jgi:hypothetical protein
MTHWENDTFENELELVATLSREVNVASIKMLRSHDELTSEIRRLSQAGVSVDALSEATGLSPDEIKSRVASDRTLL